MENETRFLDIEDRIIQLTVKNNMDRQELVFAFEDTLQAMKPMNLIKSSVGDLISSPDLGKRIANAGIGLAAGFVSKKLTIGNSHNPIKLLVGTLLQVGVTAFVSNNSEGIKSVGLGLIKSFLSKRK